MCYLIALLTAVITEVCYLIALSTAVITEVCYLIAVNRSDYRSVLFNCS